MFSKTSLADFAEQSELKTTVLDTHKLRDYPSGGILAGCCFYLEIISCCICKSGPQLFKKLFPKIILLVIVD